MYQHPVKLTQVVFSEAKNLYIDYITAGASQFFFMFHANNVTKYCQLGTAAGTSMFLEPPQKLSTQPLLHDHRDCDLFLLCRTMLVTRYCIFLH